MTRFRNRLGTILLMSLGATASAGCEIIAEIDRSQISSSSSSSSSSSASTSSSGGGAGGEGGSNTAACGDNEISGTETCDDGNTTSGDGCDATCAIEMGWACSGTPSVCKPVCGDGSVTGTEACDDGNTAADDGCDATCAIEMGWACSGTPSVCTPGCGDGLIKGAETCDDSNTMAGDGCSTACGSEAGWACAGEPSVCQGVCGDGLIKGAETCDDSDTMAGDGCSTACGSEAGWACAGEPSVCQGVCGDGLIRGAETCDDSNTMAGDGCDATCSSETGWTCVGQPSACATICGDGLVRGAEPCDDGNPINLDGCNTSCKIDTFTESEANNTSGTANGPYSYPVKISGQVIPNSDVDYYAIQLSAVTDLHIETFDANGPPTCNNIDTLATLYASNGTTVLGTDDDSGIKLCSAFDPAINPTTRHLAPGLYYVKIQSSSAMQIQGYTVLITFDAVCGDGTTQGAEECDGGANCDANCERVPTCGDNFVDAPETCDDGGTMSGDGCSSTCQTETIAEVEPNNTSGTATGPHGLFPSVRFSGAINPATDPDYFAVTLTSTSDLKIETFDGSGPNSCVGIDTLVRLYGTNGSTLLIERDQGGPGNCATIDSKSGTATAARHLPAGTYYVQVTEKGQDSIIPAYMLVVSLNAKCGNGVVEGSEECDGGANCTATCDRTPVCGDNFIDAPETCDDGNTTSGDGCSATCVVEAVNETESNNTSATANGPFAPYTLINAAISPIADVDYFAITVNATSDLRIETYDPNGPGSCATGMDSVLTLYAPDGTTVLATQDNGGIAACSRIDSTIDAGARHVAAGTYYVKVEDFQNNNVIPGYKLEVKLNALCGNGIREGSEECDGGASCSATCDRIALCGDGYVDGTETCDDSNTSAGDGCSAACALETNAEVEPNDSFAQADVAPVQLTGNAFVSGAIGPVGDTDNFRITLAQGAVVRLETFSTTNVTCGITTTLRLFDSVGTQLATDNVSGMDGCSALVMNLPAGTYYARVEEFGNNATLANYLFEVKVETSLGSETEPNEIQTEATPMAGSDVYVLGGHLSNTDSDFYAITVPPGKSVRAEIIEGGMETCESEGIDSSLTLYDAMGVVLGDDDDSGRGFCSLIDGTGAVNSHPFASALFGTTYYLQVQASLFAQTPGDVTGQFDYRLVLVIR